MYRVTTALAFIVLASIAISAWELDTLHDFDHKKYQGTWYQMYSVGIKGEGIPELPKPFCSFFNFDYLKNGKVAITASARPDGADEPPVEVNQVGDIVEPGIFEFEQDTEDGKQKYKYFVEKVGPAIHGDANLYDYAIVVTQFKDLKLFLVAARDPDTFKEKYDTQVMDYLTKNNMLENEMKTCKPMSKYLIDHYHGFDCIYR